MMGTYQKEVGKRLNAILQKTYDAEKGFGKAAERCKIRSLATWFNDRALDRHRFAIELKREITAFGEQAEDHGSLAGEAHRAWMDVKALFSSDSDEAMLKEAIRGEKAALEEYQEVLRESNLPKSSEAMLTAQMSQIDYGLVLIMSTKDLDFDRK